MFPESLVTILKSVKKGQESESILRLAFTFVFDNHVLRICVMVNEYNFLI